ncbi:MAG TPA: hypothetical protein VFK02_10135 [Kofleriaceae bacterium]|nr:hypothetical protein [Kofleriaceae bacterium]
MGLALALPVAHAEATRNGSEPWNQHVPADVRQWAQALFDQAVEKHQQLLRGDAKELYEQALALWDNPDIQWNLALVLEDLGQYLRAHQQLEGALRWGAALGDERLQQVHDQMRVLESQRLARLEVSTDEPEAEIKLDGQSWFRGPARRSTFVLPGEHYIAGGKPGYFPVTRSVFVMAGMQASVAIPLVADRILETRRWASWKPSTTLTLGAAATLLGAGLEWQSLGHRDVAARELSSGCEPGRCTPGFKPEIYARAVMENRIAVPLLVVGGTTMAVGLVLAWLNQPHTRRTEAVPLAPISVTPIFAADRAGISALIRF